MHEYLEEGPLREGQEEEASFHNRGLLPTQVEVDKTLLLEGASCTEEEVGSNTTAGCNSLEADSNDSLGMQVEVAIHSFLPLQHEDGGVLHRIQIDFLLHGLHNDLHLLLIRSLRSSFAQHN